MEKRYVMSAGLSAIERISFCALCGILVICWLCAVCSGFFATGSVASRYVSLAVYNSLTFLCLVIVRLILARDMQRTIIDVSDTSIVRKSPTRIVSVDFDSIIRFRYIHVPLLFSAGLIRHPAGTLVLSFYIKNIAGLIADVRDGLKRSENKDACDAANLEEFERVARTTDQRNERLKRFMQSLLSVLIVVLCVSIMTSLYLWHFSFAQAFVWAVFVLLLFLLAVLGAEALLSSGVRRELAMERHTHEMPNDVKVYLLSGMFAFAACLCCGILLSTAFAG